MAGGGRAGYLPRVSRLCLCECEEPGIVFPCVNLAPETDSVIQPSMSLPLPVLGQCPASSSGWSRGCPQQQHGCSYRQPVERGRQALDELNTKIRTVYRCSQAAQCGKLGRARTDSPDHSETAQHLGRASPRCRRNRRSGTSRPHPDRAAASCWRGSARGCVGSSDIQVQRR